MCNRSDSLPVQIALGEFIEAVLRMYFYLEGDFAPYWKWLAFEFRRRGFSESVAEALDQLVHQDPVEQPATVSRILDTLRERMLETGVIGSDIEDSGRVEIPLFFRFMKHIREGIRDERIRRLV